MTPLQPEPAPGRRARQKAARQRRILRAAEQLFERRGYDGTTVEDIARRAGLAVGTIYNYFPSKPELVRALLRHETDATLAAGEAVRKTPPADPGAAVRALFDVYVDLVDRHDPRLLRELWAASLAQPHTVGQAEAEMDLRLLGQLTGLIDDLRARGDLDAGVEPGGAATTLFAVYASWMLVRVTSGSPSIDAFRTEVHRGVELVMRGLLPRR